MENKKYKMRIVRGAFVNQDMLDDLNAKVIEKLEHSNWQSIDEVVCDAAQIKELQKNMTKHYENNVVPWYMDGYGIDNNDEVVVAFGADDGEGGRLFIFKKEDGRSLAEVVEYGMKKGIPKEQLDFMDITF